MRAKGSSRAAKIVVDIFMTLFLILSFIRWDGNRGFIYHAIVGTACALFFTIHICIHRKWLKAVTRSVLDGKMNQALKWKYVIDVLLLAVWGIAITTGFLAIGYFAGGIEVMHVFSRLHAVSSRVGLGLVVIHVFQHLPQIMFYIGIKSKPNGNLPIYMAPKPPLRSLCYQRLSTRPLQAGYRKKTKMFCIIRYANHLSPK